jgi:glycosyltransferase involved in cell wall biosynthesis
MKPTISIVMTAYKRHLLLQNTLRSIKDQTRQPMEIIVVEDGFDYGLTQKVCMDARNDDKLPVKYFRRVNRPALEYSNPAIPKNIGIKRATGDILIIQCAEVSYTSPNDIANMVRPIEECRGVSTLATVSARDAEGGFQEWYAGPGRAEKWFLDFCQAVRREAVMDIGGFDELYEGYGFDDDDFALRLQASGIQYRWALDVECHHQWHPVYNKNESLSIRGRMRYDKMKEEVDAGKRSPIANVGRQWGRIDD